MHIYFSGIGGVGIGPLAEISHDAGYDVSGSDKQSSPILEQLLQKNIPAAIIQDETTIAAVHAKNPIDWFVYTSALPYNHPELVFAKKYGIKTTKRDELLAYIIKDKNLKLLAVAGTHGKTTTTAMIVWTMQQLNIPVSYSIGAPISFGPSGKYTPESEWFVYECDEFDKNFLNFHPNCTIITSYDYDHPDTYPSQQDYHDAFRQFAQQSKQLFSWISPDLLAVTKDLPSMTLLTPEKTTSEDLQLLGEHNRRNGYLALIALDSLFSETTTKAAITSTLATFPGTARRFEKLANNIYSDYAHHPVEIAATLQLARELSDHIVVIYQPHQNSRQHEVRSEYSHCFAAAERIYWLPTYLARENPTLSVLTPAELSNGLDQSKIIVSELNEQLWQKIQQEVNENNLIILMGAGTIDGWTRDHLK